jgi:cytochrome c-type biogenesis protein CcmH/NrfF
MTRARLLALLLYLLALAPAGTALAATPRASFPDIEDEVMCDTCNVPLYIAESPRADQLRREIRVLIARGETKAQVKSTLKERYGPAILAMPEKKGFSLAAYLVPILVAAGLLVLLIVLLPRWRRRSREPAPDSPLVTIDDGDKLRLDDELARFDTR